MEFQSYESTVGFDPIKQPNIVPELDRERARQLRSEQAYLQGMRRNAEVEVQNARQFGKGLEAVGQGLGKLAQFSTTLHNKLVEQQDRENAEAVERGMMMAYTDGTDTSEVDALESELQSVDQKVQKAADTYEQEGGDIFTSERIRSLSQYERVGYEKSKAQMGATEYPAFYASVKDQVTIQTEDGVVGYSTVGLKPEERAALDAKVRSEFLKPYMGMNPAFLNKYLFPQMRRFEAGEASKFATAEAARIKSNRIEQAKDRFYIGMNADPGNTFLEMSDNSSGMFSSQKEARTAAINLVQSYLEDDNIPIQDRIKAYESLHGHQFMHRGMGQTTVGKAFGRDFSKLEQVLDSVKSEGARRSSNERKIIEEEFRVEFESQVKTLAENGGSIREFEIDDIEQKAEQLLGYVPSYIKNYKTAEDRDNESDRERLLSIRQTRRYLMESDLKGVSAKIYQEFNNMVKEDESLAKMPQEYTQQADEQIKGQLVDSFRSQIGDADSRTGFFVDNKQRAERAYHRKVKENLLKGMSQDDAHNDAIRSVRENIKVGTYTKDDYSKPDYRNSENFGKAQKFLRESGEDAWRTQQLPGTNDAMLKLMDFADTGVGDIPLIYRQIAENYKGVTAYDIADAQLKASGHSGLEKPPIEQEIDKASPEVQQLLRFKPSSNRTRRAFTEPGQIDRVSHNMHPSLQSFPTDVRDSVEGAQLIIAAGVPPRGAAWLSGNIQQESGWYGQRVWGEVRGDRSDRNGGLVSWMDGVAHNNFRLKRIETHLGKSITQASDAEQVQAMLWEMKTYYKSSYAAFVNPNSTDGDLIKASKRFWGYGEEGSRYQYARNIESKI
jgi:acyl-CoA-binding protein